MHAQDIRTTKIKAPQVQEQFFRCFVFFLLNGYIQILSPCFFGTQYFCRLSGISSAGDVMVKTSQHPWRAFAFAWAARGAQRWQRGVDLKNLSVVGSCKLGNLFLENGAHGYVFSHYGQLQGSMDEFGIVTSTSGCNECSCSFLGCMIHFWRHA